MDPTLSGDQFSSNSGVVGSPAANDDQASAGPANSSIFGSPAVDSTFSPATHRVFAEIDPDMADAITIREVDPPLQERTNTVAKCYFSWSINWYACVKLTVDWCAF